MNSVFVFFYITALTVNSNFIDTKAETNYKYNSNSMKWSKTAVTMSYVFAILTDTWQIVLSSLPTGIDLMIILKTSFYAFWVFPFPLFCYVAC